MSAQSRSRVSRVAAASVAMLVATGLGYAQLIDDGGVLPLPESGTGSGDWVTPAVENGLATALLYDENGLPVYTMEAELSIWYPGGGELQSGGIYGNLYDYKLFIVPTEQEPVAFLAGLWTRDGDVGNVNAIISHMDAGSGEMCEAGTMSGTFSLLSTSESIKSEPTVNQDGSGLATGGTDQYLGDPPDDPVVDPPPYSGSGDAQQADVGQQLDPQIAPGDAGSPDSTDVAGSQTHLPGSHDDVIYTDTRADRDALGEMSAASYSDSQSSTVSLGGSGGSETQESTVSSSSVQAAGDLSQDNGMEPIGDAGEPLGGDVRTRPEVQFGTFEFTWIIYGCN